MSRDNTIIKNVTTHSITTNASPNSDLFGPQFVSEDNLKRRSNSRLRQEPPTLVQNHVLGKKACA